MHIDSPIETLPGAYEQYYALLRDALMTGGSPPVDPANVVTALKVIEAAQRSAQTNAIVELNV